MSPHNPTVCWHQSALTYPSNWPSLNNFLNSEPWYDPWNSFKWEEITHIFSSPHLTQWCGYTQPPFWEELNTLLSWECLFWLPLKTTSSSHFFLQPCFDNSVKIYCWICSFLFDQLTLNCGRLVILLILLLFQWWQPILKHVGEVASVAVWNPVWHLAWVPQPWLFVSHLLFLELRIIVPRQHQFLFIIRFWSGWLNTLVVSSAFKLN